MISYHKRFRPPAEQMRLFKAMFDRWSASFRGAYRAKVQSEYAQWEEQQRREESRQGVAKAASQQHSATDTSMVARIKAMKSSTMLQKRDGSSKKHGPLNRSREEELLAKMFG